VRQLTAIRSHQHNHWQWINYDNFVIFTSDF
jgi:hypothetical protein